MTYVTAGRTNWRRLAAIPLATAVFVVLLMLVGATNSGARSKPTCFGKTATQVGTNGNDKIVAKPNAVVYAGKGNDIVTTVDQDHSKHIICGGPGNDAVEGGPEVDIVIGGEGNDGTQAHPLEGGRGDDLVVGDNANPKGNESGPTGDDYVVGGLGKDFLVGDNYASGDASGASNDSRVLGNEGDDTVVGDDAVTGSGDATGGANDHLEGADGNDLVVGDSYSPHGTATGGGNDENNSGPGNDLAVGDSYTDDGHASGNGNDKMHAADGGDFNKTCKPHTCDDVFWGDSYAGACDPRGLICLNVSGGGNDLLNADQGDDFMNGGESSHAPTGNNRDKCSGGTGIDTAGLCDYYYPDVEHILPLP